jgi:hypothetical protein
VTVTAQIESGERTISEYRSSTLARLIGWLARAKSDSEDLEKAGLSLSEQRLAKQPSLVAAHAHRRGDFTPVLILFNTSRVTRVDSRSFPSGETLQRHSDPVWPAPEAPTTWP